MVESRFACEWSVYRIHAFNSQPNKSVSIWSGSGHGGGAQLGSEGIGSDGQEGRGCGLQMTGALPTEAAGNKGDSPADRGGE